MRHQTKIKTMVRTMLTAVAASLLAAACSESYPGIDYDYTGGKDPIHNEDNYKTTPQVMLFLNEQDLFSVKTRGAGAFETDDTTNQARLDQTDFYVFAFRDGKNRYDQNEILKRDADLRYYAYAKTNIGGGAVADSGINVNCLIDGRDYRYGLKTELKQGVLTPRELSPNGDPQVIYYSKQHEQVPYNFFAYYIDDVIDYLNTSNILRTDSAIVYRLEIDGSQDIMCGTSGDLLKEIASAERFEQTSISSTWYGLSKEERDRIKSIGGYCTYTAHKNIHPTIGIKHQLTRLRFIVYPADPQVKNVTITRLSVESKYKADMTVAHRDRDKAGIRFLNEKKELVLQSIEKDDNGKVHSIPMVTKTINYDESEKGLPWYERTGTPIGSSMMVPADSVYLLHINFTAPMEVDYGDTSKIKWSEGHTEVPIYLTSGSFEPGNSYLIQVAVYGPQKIIVRANVTGWNEIDIPIHIDPDSIPGGTITW